MSTFTLSVYGSDERIREGEDCCVLPMPWAAIRTKRVTRYSSVEARPRVSLLTPSAADEGDSFIPRVLSPCGLLFPDLATRGVPAYWLFCHAVPVQLQDLPQTVRFARVDRPMPAPIISTAKSPMSGNELAVCGSSSVVAAAAKGGGSTT